MPLKPNIIERTLFYTLNQGPGPSFDMWSGTAFWSVHAALELDIFETLAAGTMLAGDLAQAIGADERGITILLGTLQSLGYVRQQGGVYSNTPMTKKWLLRSGDLNLKSFFLYWGALMRHFMPRLAESIRTGAHCDFYTWIETQPEVSRNFQEGMIQIARYVANDIVNALALPGDATRLLDVGGGHGEYSIALCRRHPALSAVIFDGEQALATGRDAVQGAALFDRITVQAGNFMQDDLPQGFDVALVFNIVHGLSAEQNIDLFRKVKDALNPGGQIIVLEQVHDIAPLPVMNAVSYMFSMAYYHLIGGQVHRYEDIHDWLQTAGFANVSRKNIVKATSVLVSAQKA